MILPLIYYGDQRLRKKCAPIEQITPEIRQLAADLTETMIAKNGVGIAAPQVGVLLRLFIIRNEEANPDGEYLLGPPEVIINPTISAPSTEQEVMTEGCLSIPGLHMDVRRPVSIQIRYQDLDGQWHEEKASGFRARVMMHENDHINGTLFIDRLSPKERKQIEGRLREIKEQAKSLR
jgi:peptide deformylase